MYFKFSNSGIQLIYFYKFLIENRQLTENVILGSVHTGVHDSDSVGGNP